jgi:SAM-dependent methyltransferase
MVDALQQGLERLTRDYPAALAARGVTPEGVQWPNAPDLATRYEVLLGPLHLAARSGEPRVRLLDLGCGPGFLLDYLQANALLDKVDYLGVDVSEATMGHARVRWPRQRFELRDVRQQPFPEGSFDYAIICGVFLVRYTNSHEEMAALVEATLKSVWPSVRVGLAFNVMSKHVDWEREDLFHWPLDTAMAFCKQHLSRHVAMRLDYGLWETAILVSRQPVARGSTVPPNWLDPGASPDV